MIISNKEIIWWDYHPWLEINPLRPDLIVVYKSQILIFEMSCPFDLRINEKKEEKETKYSKQYLKFMKRKINELLDSDFEITLVPIIVGALGLFNSSLRIDLEKYTDDKKIIEKIQKKTIINSALIVAHCNKIFLKDD